MTKKNACKTCKYFTPYFGNTDKNGNRVISKYWCVKKNGFLSKFPKQCEHRADKTNIS